MQIFLHVEKCDGRTREIIFPASWPTDNPPNNGWVCIHLANGTRKDFCKSCLRDGKAESYILEVKNAS